MAARTREAVAEMPAQKGAGRGALNEEEEHWRVSKLLLTRVAFLRRGGRKTGWKAGGPVVRSDLGGGRDSSRGLGA